MSSLNCWISVSRSLVETRPPFSDFSDLLAVVAMVLHSLQSSDFNAQADTLFRPERRRTTKSPGVEMVPRSGSELYTNGLRPFGKPSHRASANKPSKSRTSQPRSRQVTNLRSTSLRIVLLV